MKKPSTLIQHNKYWFFCLIFMIVTLLSAAIWFLQTVVAHRVPPFTPDYPQINLVPILSKPRLDSEDYNTIFMQSGLAQPAVDHLLALEDWGKAQILDTQAQFFASHEISCTHLFGPFVEEDRLSPDTNGNPVWAPPLATMENGDILLTFSTHSFGWRHGHAGLVTDAENGLSLEAVVVGSNSSLVNAGHWRNYASYMLLRLKDITPELQEKVSTYAMDFLDGVPYHLTSGFFGSKAPSDPTTPGFGVQCSYLVWYAFQHFGYDLDSDGGRLVSVYDIAHSPLLEVVQIYGMDPKDWISR